MSQLTNRAALIAGASHGLGREIAAAYLREGASVVICGRDEAALEAVRAELAPSGRIEAIACDVSKPDEVAALVERAVTAFPHLDILVNSAGVIGPKGAVEDVDWQDWVRTIEIDLFGAVLLCRAIVPHLKRRGGGKIIQLSGGGATAPFPRMSAYAAAKAGVVRFAETLAVELADHKIDVNCVAPGMLNTRMLDEVLDAGPGPVGASYHAKAVEQKTSGGASIARAAGLTVFLASRASDGITGRLISAVWDPWPELKASDVAKTDIYTLRRVVPQDRSKR